MAIYNCKHSGDQFAITKFTRDGEIESSYLCDHVTCQCPAGVRPICRHRQMLPTFLEQGLVNSNLFLDWDNGRRVVDFQGRPATVQSNEDPIDDLAPQALTDTYAPTGYCGFESKAAYEEHYSDPVNYADEIPAMEAYTRECEAERDAAVAPAADVTSGQPIKPANSWRRF